MTVTARRLATGVAHVVLPSGVDDPAAPSGGNVYGRRLCTGLPETGRAVTEILVDGGWPAPSPADSAGLAAALASVVDGADVVLDGLVACGAPDVVVPECSRLRVVVVVHLPLGDERGLAPAAAAARTAAERAVLHAAHAVVVTSAWSARRVAALHDLPPGRVHVVPPGVDPAPLAPVRADGAGLLALGALTPTKGHDVLVEALARVADQRWSARVTGPQRDPAHAAAVHGRVAALGLGDRIRLTGPVTGDALETVWSETDLLVLPSRTETYGMVVTEALARGIPVLATAAGGVPETLGRSPDGDVPGLLVAPDDVAALAEALRHWLSDADVRATARRAAHARRRTLDGWDVTARLLDGVLA